MYVAGDEDPCAVNGLLHAFAYMFLLHAVSSALARAVAPTLTSC